MLGKHLIFTGDKMLSKEFLKQLECEAFLYKETLPVDTHLEVIHKLCDFIDVCYKLRHTLEQVDKTS